MLTNSWIWLTTRATHRSREYCGSKSCHWNALKKTFANISAVHRTSFSFIKNFKYNFHSNAFFVVGRSVSSVHLIRNDANQFFGEAFVLFDSLEDIELALDGIYGNKIHNKYVKVYRSSKEQLRSYCNAMPFESLNNGHSASAPELGKKN